MDDLVGHVLCMVFPLSSMQSPEEQTQVNDTL